MKKFVLTLCLIAAASFALMGCGEKEVDNSIPFQEREIALYTQEEDYEAVLIRSFEEKTAFLKQEAFGGDKNTDFRFAAGKYASNWFVAHDLIVLLYENCPTADGFEIERVYVNRQAVVIQNKSAQTNPGDPIVAGGFMNRCAHFVEISKQSAELTKAYLLF